MDNKLKKSKLLSLFVLILSFLPFMAGAQRLSLYDAVNKSVQNYPLLQQRRAEVASGQAHIKTVKGNALPTLLVQDQFDLGTSNSEQGTYFSLGIVPSTPGGSATARPNYNPNPVNVGLTALIWEFYNFGYYKAQRNEAKAQLAVSEAYLGTDKYLLQENVVSLYLDWLKKFRLLRIQQENMQRAQTILTAIRATVIGGLKPGVDSATASAAYEDAHIGYLQALDAYNYDKITLSTYTGISGDIMPDTDFISAAMKQPAAQLQDSVASGHPLINLYEKQYELQLANNNSIAKRYLPRLSLNSAAWVRNSGISYSGVYPTDALSDGLPYNKFNYVAGLELDYNLFDLKHRHDRLVEGRYDAEARKNAMETETLTLDKMMQQANSTYATTQEKLNAIPVQLYSARQAYSQQLALYRAGLNTLIDLTNAQYVLLQAETNYVITQDELLQVLYIRAGLAGQLDNFLQNSKR